MNRGLRGQWAGGYIRGFILAALAASATPAVGGTDDGPSLTLGGDFVAMADVAGTGARSRLAVVVSGQEKPRRHRTLLWVDKHNGRLVVASREAIPDDVGAFDVCRLDPASPVETLPARARKRRLCRGRQDPLTDAPTLFAHSSDDSLPRVRLCYPLFPGQPPALVVPTLAGFDIFRRTVVNGPYAAHAVLGADEQTFFLKSPQSAGANLSVLPKLATFLEMPEVDAVDFNGDGLPDLCVSKADALECFIQDPAHGFAGAQPRKFFFDVRTDQERKDASIFVESRMIPQDSGPPLLALLKCDTDIGNVHSSLYLFRRAAAGGGFEPRPIQTITRNGFFQYQEFLDLRGDGKPGIVAPVTPTGWTDLAHIFLTRSVDVEFLWYGGRQGGFSGEPVHLTTVTVPVDFKNPEATFAVLPSWNVHLDKAAGAQRQVAFFPEKEAVELFTVTPADNGGVTLESVWRKPARVGNLVQVTNLGGDGVEELVFAYPHETGWSDKLVLFEDPGMRWPRH